jgi:hypothetical protein
MGWTPSSPIPGKLGVGGGGGPPIPGKSGRAGGETLNPDPRQIGDGDRGFRALSGAVCTAVPLPSCCLLSKQSAWVQALGAASRIGGSRGGPCRLHARRGYKPPRQQRGVRQLASQPSGPAEGDGAGRRGMQLTRTLRGLALRPAPS